MIAVVLPFFKAAKGSYFLFNIGEIFVYGASGVCRVDDICVRDCGTGKREYYVLQPVYDARSTVYIPTDSEKLSSHMRSLLSEKEVYDIIDTMPTDGFAWIQNDKERSETFRDIVENGTRTDLVNLISTLHHRRTELAARGKKLRSSDEAIMQRAERLLYGEFAWVLKIDPSEVVNFIRKRVE